MKRIFKYTFRGMKHSIQVPRHSYPCHFELFNGEWVVWVVISDDDRKMDMHLQVVGTGFEFENHWYQVATVRDGPFMWHLLGWEDLGYDF
jgi:hypothetical protein